MEMEEVECCPDVPKRRWEEKTITWREKPFYRYKVYNFFHIPIGFSRALKRALSYAKSKGMGFTDPLMMVEKDSGLFSSTMLLSLDKVYPDPNVVTLSGTYLTKMFIGPYKDMGKYIQTMDQWVKSKGLQTKELLFYYTNCPKCAEKQGGTKTVILAKV